MYRDLGVEQLGAVYEGVLDYRPLVVRVPESPTPRASALRTGGRSIRAARAQLRLEPGSGARKATGTFYTPRSITTYLVRQVLAPLVAGASPDEILSRRIVDPAMGSGAFLVAACRYLAGADQAAVIAGGGCHPSDISDADRRLFRRLVAQRCLYGVDRNPIAVQLARLSLWLCTLAPDRPLTFLDHHLQVGDSLVGASAEDVGRWPPGVRASGAERGGGDAAFFDSEGVGPAVRMVLPARLRIARSETRPLPPCARRSASSLGSSAGPLRSRRGSRRPTSWCGFAFRGGLRGRTTSLPARSPTRFSGAVVAAGPGCRAVAVRGESHRVGAPVLSLDARVPEVFYSSDGEPLAAAGFDAVLETRPGTWSATTTRAMLPESPLAPTSTA